MRASVVLQTPDGARHQLGHGDFIGRLWTAALVLDDPRVSEAHALVSLRDGALRLLSLRGRFAVDGKPLRELTLVEGQEIALAQGLTLRVVAVHLPASVLSLAMEGLARQPLASACWLVTRPQPELLGRPPKQPAAAFWFTGGSWRARIGDGAVQEVDVGWTTSIDGHAVELVPFALERVGQATRLGGKVDAPLRIVSHFDTVVIEREGVTTLTLAGVSARLVSELMELQAPLEWQALTAALWPEQRDERLRRSRFDTVVGRVRRKLRQASVRPDLIRADGSGKYLLHLEPGDEAVLA